MSLSKRELRIGNIIQECGISNLIHEVTPEIIQFISQGANTYYGVPLTREILYSSGFKSYSSNLEFYYSHKEFSDLHISAQNTMDLRFKEVFEFVAYTCESPESNMYRQIRYVHELQNLYFALYGEELNIVI